MTQPIKFETSEAFNKHVTGQFLPTVQGCAQGMRVGAQFTHEDICEVHIQSGIVREVYSLYRNNITKEANWCKGVLGKLQGKNIN